jgi:hypothetical protein
MWILLEAEICKVQIFCCGCGNTNQIRANMGGALGQNLSVETSMEVVNCKLIKNDEIMCL